MGGNGMHGKNVGTDKRTRKPKTAGRKGAASLSKKAAPKKAPTGASVRNAKTGNARPKPSSMDSARKTGAAGRNVQRGSDNAGRIRDVALDLFAKKSFSAVTIKEIGQATGLNTAMIYYYFRDKEDLFRDTVETAVQRSMEAFEARRAPDADPETVVTNWLETHIEQLDLIRKFVKISVDYASSANRLARIDDAIKRFYEAEHDILAAAMKKGTDGRFDQQEIDRMIELFSTYLDGVMVRSVIAPDFDAKGAIHSLRDYVLELMRVQDPSREPPRLR